MSQLSLSSSQQTQGREHAEGDKGNEIPWPPYDTCNNQIAQPFETFPNFHLEKKTNRQSFLNVRLIYSKREQGEKRHENQVFNAFSSPAADVITRIKRSGGTKSDGAGFHLSSLDIKPLRNEAAIDFSESKSRKVDNVTHRVSFFFTRTHKCPVSFFLLQGE